MKYKTGIVFFVFNILILVTFLFSCQIHEDEPELPPQLPSFASLEMDFSLFRNQPVKILDEDNSNWQSSVANIKKWDTLVSLPLFVPISAFKDAADFEPTYETGSWLWSYDSVIEDVKYMVNLFGTFENKIVTWDMFITKEGFYDNFLWVQGTQSTSNSEGQWILHKSYTENYDFLQLDWTFNSLDSTNTLKYTNITQGSEDYGSYIYFGNNMTGEYNCYFDIYDVKKNELTKIWWNSIDYSGKIINLQDETQFCWDKNLSNIECSSDY
jgi:hypothetical protein